MSPCILRLPIRSAFHRIDGGDTGKLLALIEKKREQAARQLGRTVRIVSCYEAGRDGFWLHRLLIRQGIDNRVLNSASILVDRRARRATRTGWMRQRCCVC